MGSGLTALASLAGGFRSRSSTRCRGWRRAGCSAANVVEFWQDSRWQAVDELGEEVGLVAALRNLAEAGADVIGWLRVLRLETELNAPGRNVAFPSSRPVLADQCRNRQRCLPTMRVRLHGFSSAQRLRDHSRRYGLCGCRHVPRVPARDALSFLCVSFS